MGDALAELSRAARRAESVAHRPPSEPFVVHVGASAPMELAVAAGLRAVRLLPVGGRPAPVPDARMGPIRLGWRGRSLLEQVLALGERPTAILLSGREQSGLYASLRELARLQLVHLPPCRYLDLPTLPHRSTARYRRRRVHEVTSWLGEVVGAPIEEAALRAAVDETTRRDHAWSRLTQLREADVPALTGTTAAVAARAGAWLRVSDHDTLLRRLADEVAAEPRSQDTTGRRMLLVGRDLPPAVIEALERGGTVVAGPDRRQPTIDHAASAAGDHLADQAGHSGLLADPGCATHETVARVAARARAVRADEVVHVVWEGDEADTWDAARLPAALAREGITGRTLRLPDADLATVCAEVDARSDSDRAQVGASRVAVGDGPSDADRPTRPPERGEQERSRKVLASTASFSRHQRAWFAEVAARARDGEPFAVVNADFPHELLRALDIPYVVNQWWASIVGAKRLTPTFLAALAEHDYATTVEVYSTQGLASALVSDEDQPWGGLPRPTMLGAMLGTAPTVKIFTSWAREVGADLYLLERSMESRWELPMDWWDDLPRHWDELLEDARLDLMRDELVGVVRGLERQTGRRFDEARFEQALTHANAQAAISRETRDIIAAARPVPAGVVDLMPATMIPQWHRGTAWAVDAAGQVRDEVIGLVEAGSGVVEDERMRLMWVGRGFWGDTGLYQCLEESHGAVFVWSMYLALAADGYLRHVEPDQDPLRALASRFVTMGDELRMPTWAGPWHVKEAHTHGVDGAVAIADADPFVIAALRAAGIPVLALRLDNLDTTGTARVRGQLREFADDLRDGHVERHLAADAPR